MFKLKSAIFTVHRINQKFHLEHFTLNGGQNYLKILIRYDR
jgi:hypothetical protein